MKLSTKYSQASILAYIIVLFASSFCYYFIIRYILINELDQDLKVEEQEVVDYVNAHHMLPSPSDYNDQQVLIEPLNGNIVKRNFSSINIFDKKENETFTARQLVFPIAVSGKNYKVLVLKSQKETEYLIQVILAITLGVVILLLLLLFIINRFLLNKMWRPFNLTLQELKQFNLTSKKKLQLESTTIDEFTELNNAVKAMVLRVKTDYNALKLFTENASHEMQTPIAIINSKLDVLIQDASLNANQLQQLQVIYDAISKLSRLTQSLLLLTKIENDQFNEKEEIELDKVIKAKAQQFEEFIHNKRLTIIISPGSNIIIKGNKYIVDILMGNLFTNAIRYNKQNGSIQVSFSTHKFTISNSSNLPELDHQKIFQRFYRHTDTKEDGNGLGLSIIKQICDVSSYGLAYNFHDNLHEFSVLFKSTHLKAIKSN